MAEQADARRMQILETLYRQSEPKDIEQLAKSLKCDMRTIRRDIEILQEILSGIQGVELRKGKVSANRSGFTAGYFTAQLEQGTAAKEAIARTIVSLLPENSAIALTAGSTTYTVAQHIRRRAIADETPRNLIVFTNSLPALHELISGDVSTGILGEIYAPDDCAFHSPEFRSAFQPSIAVVGASGVLLNTSSSSTSLDLFSHRAEEAAFLKQLLKGIPELIVAVDSRKLGKRHPWSFGGATLSGKSVTLITDSITEEQRVTLDTVSQQLAQQGTHFRYQTAH